jgi:hypothetical protein
LTCVPKNGLRVEGGAQTGLENDGQGQAQESLEALLEALVMDAGAGELERLEEVGQVREGDEPGVVREGGDPGKERAVGAEGNRDTGFCGGEVDC